MAETFDPHCVWFVGAGPGDRELITLKGYRLLQQAQVVIYAGSLINTELLAYCPPQAECHDSAALHLEQILDLMEAGVKAGKTVVRLQTGDVSLYGSVREQADPPRDPLAGGAGRQRFPRRGGGAGVEYGTRSLAESDYYRLEGRTPVPRANSWKPLPAIKPRWRFTCRCNVFTGWRSGWWRAATRDHPGRGDLQGHGRKARPSAVPSRTSATKYATPGSAKRR